MLEDCIASVSLASNSTTGAKEREEGNLEKLV